MVCCSIGAGLARWAICIWLLPLRVLVAWIRSLLGELTLRLSAGVSSSLLLIVVSTPHVSYCAKLSMFVFDSPLLLLLLIIGGYLLSMLEPTMGWRTILLVVLRLLLAVVLS
jgi:hypothetical protein